MRIATSSMHGLGDSASAVLAIQGDWQQVTQPGPCDPSIVSKGYQCVPKVGGGVAYIKTPAGVGIGTNGFPDSRFCPAPECMGGVPGGTCQDVTGFTCAQFPAGAVYTRDPMSYQRCYGLSCSTGFSYPSPCNAFLVNLGYSCVDEGPGGNAFYSIPVTSVQSPTPHETATEAQAAAGTSFGQANTTPIPIYQPLPGAIAAGSNPLINPEAGVVTPIIGQTTLPSIVTPQQATAILQPSPNPMAPVAAADSQLIAGIDNKTLMLAGGALVVLMMLGGRR